MKITALKEQVKNPNRVSIFVDGVYSFSLTLDQLLEQKLKNGAELDEPKLVQLKKLSDEGKVYARALEWVLSRPHSTKELHEYFFRKKIDAELGKSITERLQKHGYLNDEAFASWWLQGRLNKQKSLKSIRMELMRKGIATTVIDALFAKLKASASDTGADADALQQLVAKLQTRPRYTDQDRLKRYLLGKGFHYSDIQDALDNKA